MTASRHSDLAIFRRLLLLARPYWPHMAGLFVLSLLSTPLALLGPLPLKIAVDSVIGTLPLPGVLSPLVPSFVGGDTRWILLLAVVLMVGITLASHLTDLTGSLLRTYTQQRLLLGFRARLLGHAQRLSLAYHDSRGTADSVYRIQNDAPALQHIAMDGVIPFVTNGIKLAAMIYVTARIDWQLALVALAVSPFFVAVSRVVRRRIRKQSREVKKLESGAQSVVQEVLTSLRVVRAFGREPQEEERYVGLTPDRQSRSIADDRHRRCIGPAGHADHGERNSHSAVRRCIARASRNADSR